MVEYSFYASDRVTMLGIINDRARVFLRREVAGRVMILLL